MIMYSGNCHSSSNDFCLTDHAIIPDLVFQINLDGKYPEKQYQVNTLFGIRWAALVIQWGCSNI